VEGIPSAHEDQMVWRKAERHYRNQGEETKPQTGTPQVSVTTGILCFHPRPRRQDMDPAGRSHAGRCSVNTGTSAQSDGGDPVGLCWVWVAVVELTGKRSGPWPWVLQDSRVTGATSMPAAALVPTGGEEA